MLIEEKKKAKNTSAVYSRPVDVVIVVGGGTFVKTITFFRSLRMDFISTFDVNGKLKICIALCAMPNMSQVPLSHE